MLHSGARGEEVEVEVGVEDGEAEEGEVAADEDLDEAEVVDLKAFDCM